MKNEMIKQTFFGFVKLIAPSNWLCKCLSGADRCSLSEHVILTCTKRDLNGQFSRAEVFKLKVKKEACERISSEDCDRNFPRSSVRLHILLQLRWNSDRTSSGFLVSFKVAHVALFRLFVEFSEFLKDQTYFLISFIWNNEGSFFERSPHYQFN